MRPASRDRIAVRIGQRRAHALENLLEIEGADVGPEDQQADDEAGVADAVGDERLVGRVRGALPLEVEADQQVRADADQLPAQEHLEEVVRQDQVEHREAEQRQVHEEAAEAAAAVKMAVRRVDLVVLDLRLQFVAHVADREHVDQAWR